MEHAGPSPVIWAMMEPGRKDNRMRGESIGNPVPSVLVRETSDRERNWWRGLEPLNICQNRLGFRYVTGVRLTKVVILNVGRPGLAVELRGNYTVG
jgi:hypothetical protein